MLQKQLTLFDAKVTQITRRKQRSHWNIVFKRSDDLLQVGTFFYQTQLLEIIGHQWFLCYMYSGGKRRNKCSIFQSDQREGETDAAHMICSLYRSNEKRMFFRSFFFLDAIFLLLFLFIYYWQSGDGHYSLTRSSPANGKTYLTEAVSNRSFFHSRICSLQY